MVRAWKDLSFSEWAELLRAESDFVHARLNLMFGFAGLLACEALHIEFQSRWWLLPGVFILVVAGWQSVKARSVYRRRVAEVRGQPQSLAEKLIDAAYKTKGGDGK